MKQIELPLTDPPFSTLHHQAAVAGILTQNPSIRNFYLNQAVRLICSRRFLHGYTSPVVSVLKTDFQANPYIEKTHYAMRFLGKKIHHVIQKLLEHEYYVFYTGVDDYYVPGKSWYHERHFPHNGLICGFDKTEKTYSLYAYDKDWICTRFQTTQNGFERGRRAAMREEAFGSVWGMRAKPEEVPLHLNEVYQNITLHLNSPLSSYPLDDERDVYGLAVHDFIGMYLDKLADESIPYDRMDRRVFRMVWEHKKLMYERLVRVEEALELPPECSTAYQSAVEDANTMRMLYASHHMKRRDALLPVIKKKLLDVKDREERILTEFAKKMEVAMK